MRLVNLEKEYVDFLKEDERLYNIRDGKYSVSSNGGRKYVGICLKNSDFDYFLPIHKGSREMKKPGKTYIDKTGKRKIKRSKFDIEFIETDKVGNETLRSILKVAYMIPVPKGASKNYDISKEADKKKKIDFINLSRWFNNSKIEYEIKERCNYIFSIKMKELEGDLKQGDKRINYSRYFLNFKVAEDKCAEWTRVNTFRKVEKKEKLPENWEYYHPTNNVLHRVLGQAAAQPDLIVSLPENDFLNNNYSSLNLYKISNNKIELIDNLFDNIQEMGVGNLDIIIELKAEEIKLNLWKWKGL